MRVPGLFVCLLALSGCVSAPQSRDIQTQGLGDLPSAVELAETPFYPQTEYQCGPAALATVLGSHGLNVTPLQLSGQVYIPGRKGSLQIEMIAASRRHEMFPYPLSPHLADLFTEVAAGNPVLVLQNLGLDWYPQWHYAVVIGYDMDNNEVILRSGETRRWLTPFEVFERTWQRADYWALVIVPVGDVPKTAKPVQYLKTALAFEQIGRMPLALKAYEAATVEWPEDATVWMALGNTAYSSRNWPEAIQAFQQASGIDPGLTASWNNLAYALHADGCPEQALQALQCALAIAPDDANLQDSQRELARDMNVKQRMECPAISCGD